MLDSYIQSVANRLRLLAWARVAGIVAVSIAVLTVLGAWYVRWEVPTADQLLILRVLGSLAIAAGTLLLVRLSLGTSAIVELEKRVPEFAGRLDPLLNTSGNTKKATPKVFAKPPGLLSYPL